MTKEELMRKAIELSKEKLDKMYYGNNKTDAKNIGFDDSFIYDELKLNPEDRKLPSEVLLHNEAIKTFEAWMAKEDKTEY